MLNKILGKKYLLTIDVCNYIFAKGVLEDNLNVKYVPTLTGMKWDEVEILIRLKSKKLEELIDILLENGIDYSCRDKGY